MRIDFPLRMVDGLRLKEEYREVLRPGELVRGRDGRLRRLPRWFYEIPNWRVALKTRLSPHFVLWELIDVDVREHVLLRTAWPRYVPCAVTLLAAHLELLRAAVDTYVHVAANGGYRSPRHALATHASTHCWGTAANLYRIGDDDLDDKATITRYHETITRVMPGVYLRPYGAGVGEADDHIHLDLGFTVVVPHGAAGEAKEAPEPASETETAGVGAP
ncbi:MAG TPA: hypothetical protein VFX98_05250 [Longimicrobiaceae bacterium]|nr:hypothetical protein [Longimicrobiaceae bacterium]